METTKEYYAFISYKREDEYWAKWLQHKLEHYKLPYNLNGRTDLPREIRPVFRDVSDLSSGILAEEIDKALRSSLWLIVICSPRSAKSPWVCKEAQSFIDLGHADHIIPFVIEGNPFSNDSSTECFPEALLNLTDRQELLATNINEMGRDAAVIKVVARMFELRFDALWQRYEKEKRRKRWIWFFGASLIASMGIGVGLYFNKQNKVIENQNKRLQQDSIIMANHIERITGDSIMLSIQYDSILYQSNLILNQRDSIIKTTKRLQRSNRLLKEERNNVLKAKINQDVSIIKHYLSQKMPEMAIIPLSEVEKNISLLDSAQLFEYSLLKQSICDSILSSPALLVDIKDKAKQENMAHTKTIHSNSIVSFHDYGDEYGDKDTIYIHNRSTNATDTIAGDGSWVIFETNRNMTHFATYHEDNDITDIDDLDMVYSPEKSGIRIYSLETGEIINFIGCRGWYYFLTYPMGLSNNGRYLIYQEGLRQYYRISIVDFTDRKRTAIRTCYSFFHEGGISAFCPNDKYYFFASDNTIDIYTTQTKELIHTFKYDEYEDVYWDESNNICIASKGNIYIWHINEIKNHVFKTGGLVLGVAISNNKRYAAAACDNGIIYIWDIKRKSLVFAKNIIDYPEDVAFTNDNKSLWVISKYSGIATVDIEKKTIKSINYESGAPNAFNYPRLYMTRDGHYCICSNYDYAIYDLKGNLIEQGYEDEATKKTKKILSEFVRPEEYDYDSEQIDSKAPIKTIKRLSTDEKMCIEGYYNGEVKIFSIEQKNRLNTLISKIQ